jgi:hypothetical protein
MKRFRIFFRLGDWIRSRVKSAYKKVKDRVYSFVTRLQPISPLFTFLSSFFAFLSLCAVIVTITLSIRNISKSAHFSSEMIAYIDSLNTLLTKVNDQISYLPTSVSRFDSTVRGLNEAINKQQQEFQKSISGLQRNIDGFSKGIADYGKTLAKIVEASDKQLALLDKQQKQLEKELMRKPKLKFEVKQCLKDTLGRLTIMPQIVNEGDDITRNCIILLAVPAEFDFQSAGFMVWDSTARIQQWSYEFNVFIPYESDPKLHPSRSNTMMRFSIKILPNVKLPYKLQYFLYHDKGADTDTLVINLPK